MLLPRSLSGRAKEIPGAGDLRRKPDLTDDAIKAATDAFRTDEGAKPSAFQSGHRIGVGKDLAMHRQARSC